MARRYIIRDDPDMPEPGTVESATRQAIQAAEHLTDADAGAIAALLACARKIDTLDTYLAHLAEYAEEKRQGRPPSQDNVSMPTYLKFCESLGLTPAGRVRGEVRAPEKQERGKLAQLQTLKGVSA